MAKQRPKNLDLMSIRLPLPGIVSIMPRISGAGLFLSLPVLLCLFQSSVSSPESYASFQQVLTNPLWKIFLLLVLFGFVYHLCAGIRYLALDLHWGAELAKARASSVAVLVVSILLTLILGARLW